MKKKRLHRRPSQPGQSGRAFSDEFKREAVQMLLDGHTASSIVQRLGPLGYEPAVSLEA